MKRTIPSHHIHFVSSTGPSQSLYSQLSSQTTSYYPRFQQVTYMNQIVKADGMHRAARTGFIHSQQLVSMMHISMIIYLKYVWMYFACRGYSVSIFVMLLLSGIVLAQTITTMTKQQEVTQPLIIDYGM